MKTLITTNNGGHPLKLNNLRHLQDGFVETISSLLKGVGEFRSNYGFIVYGCEFTYSNGGNTLDWTAGAVVLNDEVMLIDAGQVTKTGIQGFRFTSVTSYDAVDPQTYANASSHSVHNIVKANIVAADMIVGYLYASTVKRLPEMIHGDFKEGSGISIGASHDIYSPVWTWTDGEVNYTLNGNIMTIDLRVLVSNLTEDAQQLLIEIPDNKECDGFFSALFTVNNVIGIGKCFDGTPWLQITSLGTDYASGSTEVYGQVKLQVKDA
jgi:hypothetical protein